MARAIGLLKLDSLREYEALQRCSMISQDEGLEFVSTKYDKYYITCLYKMLKLNWKD